MTDQTRTDGASEQPETIGDCWMESDGTLNLRLRARSDDGTIGDGLLRYPPDHKQYATILNHVGPIAPNERKPVKPFP